jgi:TonB family protein
LKEAAVNRIALSLAVLCLSTPGLLRAVEGNALLVRYALLVGGREAGKAPSSAGVLSRDELTKTLIDWNPGADNGEVRRVFALNDLGEVARQAVELPLSGGQVEGTYHHGGASFEVRLSVLPGEQDITLLAQMLRNGKHLSSPSKIVQALGDRGILSANGGPEAPFVFFVVEVDRVPRETLKSADRLPAAWPRDTKPVDGQEIPALKVLKKVNAVYPPAAKEARITGTVILRVLVGRTGEVEDVEVLKGLPKGLSAAAVAAVRQWRFEPATVDGKPVPARTTLTFNFSP